MQKWKPISGYEHCYEISDSGDVKSLGRYITLRNGSKRYVSEKILRPKNTGGYLFVALSKEGVRKDHYIHRLVAKAFLRKCPERDYVNHKDGNPSNNSLSNLEWVTHSENILHAYRVGLYRNKRNFERKVEEMNSRNIQNFQFYYNDYKHNAA